MTVMVIQNDASHHVSFQIFDESKHEKYPYKHPNTSMIEVTLYEMKDREMI